MKLFIERTLLAKTRKTRKGHLVEIAVFVDCGAGREPVGRFIGEIKDAAKLQRILTPVSGHPVVIEALSCTVEESE